MNTEELFRGSDDVHATIEDLAVFLASSFDEVAANNSWHKPWRDIGRAKNFVSDWEFSYLNSMIFWKAMRQGGFQHPLWATFKQWSDAGRWVKKGAKATKALRPTGAEGRLVPDGSPDDGEGATDFATVPYFNIAQTQGPLPAKAMHAFIDPMPIAEFVVRATGASVANGGTDAKYTPATDVINMPDRITFCDTDDASATEHYYGTLLHELVHWTGHSSRLGRKVSSGEEYAFEELVAEFGCSRLTVDLRVSPAIRDDHKVYLATWATRLRAKPRDLTLAVFLANQAVDHLLAHAGARRMRDEALQFPVAQAALVAALSKVLPNSADVIHALERGKLIARESKTGTTYKAGRKWTA